MRNFLKFLKEIWTDESGSGSSKRLLGTIIVIAFIYTLIKGVKPDPNLVSALEYIAIGCILATSADKAANIFKNYRSNKNKIDEDGSNS